MNGFLSWFNKDLMHFLWSGQGSFWRLQENINGFFAFC